MAGMLAVYLDELYVFVFVLARLGGLMMTAPILGAKSVPMQIRALLAVALSLVVTPIFWSIQIDRPDHMFDLAILIAQETMLGMTLGLGVMILFMGLQVAGQTIAQMSALSLADVFGASAVFAVADAALGSEPVAAGAALGSEAWGAPGRRRRSVQGALLLHGARLRRQLFVCERLEIHQRLGQRVVRCQRRRDGD